MRIKSVRVENFRGLSRANFEPNENVIFIYGANGSGKSSLIDAIFCTLAGDRSSPDVPVRLGSENAECSIELSDGMVVERRWNTSGNTYLTVKNAHGYPEKKPQALLNSLFSKLGFNPLSFSRMDRSEQADEIARALGVNDRWNEIGRETKRLIEERRSHKRFCESYEKEILPPGAELKDFNAVISDISQLEESLKRVRDEHYEHDGNIERAKFEIKSANESIQRLEDEMEKLTRRIEEIKRKIELDRWKRDKATSRIDEEKGNCLASFDMVKHIEGELSLRRREYQEAIALSVAAEKSRQAEDKVTEIRTKILEINDRIDSLNREKDSIIERARESLGVQGFDWGDDGISFNGIPVDGLSTSEKIKIGLHIANLSSPKIKDFAIMDGKTLDEDSIRELFDWAKESGAVVWVEWGADEPAHDGLVIEEGVARKVSAKPKDRSSEKAIKPLPGQKTLEFIEPEDNPF